MGIAGTTGTMDYSAGFGTPVSPNISQNPTSFGGKTVGSNSNTSTGAPSSPSENDATIDQIYSKDVTPSPDEVITGLKYELHNMSKKDKAKAKEMVLGNLKKDPHYYGKLGMLNIDDKDMIKTTPTEPSSQESQMNERVKLLQQMLASKGKKSPPPQSFKDALEETRQKKAQRYIR